VSALLALTLHSSHQELLALETLTVSLTFAPTVSVLELPLEVAVFLLFLVLLVLIVELQVPALLKLLLEETAPLHLFLKPTLPVHSVPYAMLELVLPSPQRPTELLA